jgi:hypothetical protein
MLGTCSNDSGGYSVGEKLKWSRTGKQSLGSVILVVEAVGKGTDEGFPKGF